ncbi:MAG: 50S ribosomal protein L29 [Patescibacteria group bacterium]|nr:50S ribosomal protein L29 [Patescibacteria group bacterium]
MKKITTTYLAKSLDELEKERLALAKEQKDLELRLSLGQEKKTHQRRIVRRKLAVLQTIIGQKRIKL